MFLIVLTACEPLKVQAPPVPPPAVAPIPMATAMEALTVSLLYPKGDSEVEMGQTVKFILRVTDGQGQPARDGQVTISVHDPGGRQVAEIPALFGDGEVYRSGSWKVPQRTRRGRGAFRWPPGLNTPGAAEPGASR